MDKLSSTVMIKQIAQKAGLSPSTVSVVLNGKGDNLRISKQTQEKIRTIAKEMDYQPNIYARRLRSGAKAKTKLMIAVFWNKKLFDSEMAPFFIGAFDTIEKNGYGVELVVKIYEEGHLDDYYSIMDPQYFNGVIINGATPGDIEQLEKQNIEIPIVITSQVGKKVSSVLVDDYEVGKQCARLFYQAGYKTAGILKTAAPSVGSVLRMTGFRAEAKILGLECRDEWILTSDEFNLEKTAEDFGQFLDGGNRVDCLFVQRSIMALGVQSAAIKRGLKIPEDLAILGCGIKKSLSENNPSISMVGGYMSAYGKASVDLVMLLLSNQIRTPINTLTPPVFLFNDSFKAISE